MYVLCHHLNLFLILAFISCQLSGLNVSASSSPASEFIGIRCLLDLEFLSHLSSNTAAAITLPVCSPSVSAAPLPKIICLCFYGLLLIWIFLLPAKHALEVRNIKSQRLLRCNVSQYFPEQFFHQY